MPECLVRGPRLADRAGEHRALDPHKEMQEIRGAAVRGASMLWTGLPEAREVLRDRKIAGHTNFLPTGQTHPIDPIDHRFVAHQDRGDHIVEEPHVLLILLWIAGIIFSILLRIAAGAE